MFLMQYAFGEGVFGIARQYRYFSLYDHGPTVEFIADEMYAGAVYLFSCLEGASVSMQTLEFGQ